MNRRLAAVIPAAAAAAAAAVVVGNAVAQAPSSPASVPIACPGTTVLGGVPVTCAGDGVSHLHATGVIHRDLAARNFLVIDVSANPGSTPQSADTTFDATGAGSGTLTILTPGSAGTQGKPSQVTIAIGDVNQDGQAERVVGAAATASGPSAARFTFHVDQATNNKDLQDW
jgi:microcompartment protein CcmK/EutM